MVPAVEVIHLLAALIRRLVAVPGRRPVVAMVEVITAVAAMVAAMKGRLMIRLNLAPAVMKKRLTIRARGRAIVTQVITLL